MTLKQAIVRIAELEAEITRLSPKATVSETPSFLASLSDARPFMPATAGGIRQPWESLWREVQTALHGGIMPRNSGLPNKSCPAGHRDPSFPYSIRERAAMGKIREVSASLTGTLRERVAAAFMEAGEAMELPATHGLPEYKPSSTW